MRVFDYSKCSTSELICVPFLDSTETPAAKAAVLNDLRGRGFGSASVFVLRVVAGFGLWWNILAWESDGLDLLDVFYGYSFNFGFVAVGALVLAAFRLISGGSPIGAVIFALSAALVSFGFLIAAFRGWKRRRERNGW